MKIGDTCSDAEITKSLKDEIKSLKATVKEQQIIIKGLEAFRATVWREVGIKISKLKATNS